MKLLLENWRKYLNEDTEVPDWRRAPKGMNQLAADLIASYIIRDRQPSKKNAEKLIEYINSGDGSQYVDWYEGTAYRGLMISEEWVDMFFNVGIKDITRGVRRSGFHRRPKDLERLQKAKKELLTKPNILKLFKKLKGEITVNVEKYHGPGFGGYGGTIVDHKRLIESWSREYDVARNYSSPSSGAHPHQMKGFSDFLVKQAQNEKPSKVLSVILEADGSKSRGGGQSGFIDISKLYEAIPIMSSEAPIEEVPFIYKAGSQSEPYITKIHVPYSRFEKAFKKSVDTLGASGGLADRDLAKVSPLIKECAMAAGFADTLESEE